MADDKKPIPASTEPSKAGNDSKPNLWDEARSALIQQTLTPKPEDIIAERVWTAVKEPVKAVVGGVMRSIQENVTRPTSSDFVTLGVMGVEEVSKACGELTPSVAKNSPLCNAADLMKGRTK